MKNETKCTFSTKILEPVEGEGIWGHLPVSCWLKVSGGGGGRGGDTFKTSSPYEQLLPLPTPYFKMFLERSLNDPPPLTTPLQASFTATPSPSITPSPLKNVNHTLKYHPRLSGVQ